MRTLHVSVREARMSVERILLTRGLPTGTIHGVRESILLSEALGLGGFRYLLERHAALDWSAFAAVCVRDREDGSVLVDGGGVHVWLILPTVVDVAVAQARFSGAGDVHVTNVVAATELQVATALAKRYGTTVTVSGSVLSACNTSRPVTAEQWDPVLLAAIRHGFDVEEQLWRAVHALSNTALAPDSVVSRRHAGPVVLQDDGTIRGRLPSDDDFDMNMLKKVVT